MKTISTLLFFTLSLAILSICGQLHAQSSIPNNGFENWDTGFTYDNPTSWETPNATIAGLWSNSWVVFEETDSVYAGSSSVKLESKSITIFGNTISVPGLITLGNISVDIATTEVNINGGTPISDNPVKVTGYYNYSPVSSDQCYFDVVVLNFDVASSTILDTIGAGIFTSTSATNGWQSFEIPITYFDTLTPNYLNITMLSSNPNNIIPGSILYVDELSLEIIPTNDIQNINLPQGWSFFSSYVDPNEPNIDSLCAPIVSEVLIAKDGVGLTYWPQYNVNVLGDIQIGKGYQIKMNTAQTLVVEGVAVVPDSTTVVIPQGWSFLGYLRQSPGAIDLMLSTVSNELIIVKNGIGQVYWPPYTNMIGNMNPGEGYQIKMATQQNLVYPAN
jgi:hypothetical protein